ncbi:MAG: Gluconate 5-dehydrogenase [Alphaproteobacteria bacterium MarineAlpha2_Bin1]|nr:MAG: Gluconate 5-dehydrogenase [Alphaproteobacteria bacterium MarineAlpha2_Bin1]|tara:strand:+ start:1375 stop:2124 length:750 start_codon:yes stop_codon:yes gene_type:complete
MSNKTILLTGASSGIGREFSHYLANLGFDLILASRNLDELNKLKSSISNKNISIHTQALDVTDSKSINQVVNFIDENLGSVDVLINNAGITIENFILDMTLSDFDRIFSTNVRGPWLIANGIAKQMINKKKEGKIINISSILAENVIPKQSLYSMTKSALLQMTKSMALEWARYNINVNAISPGFIITNMNKEFFDTINGIKMYSRWPNKRVGNPDMLLTTLNYLLDNKSKYVTGAVLTVDDGQSLKRI